MSDDYQVRKDLNRSMRLINQLDKLLSDSGVGNLSELFSKYYDCSEVDVRNWKLNDDLKELDGSLTNLSESLDDLTLELYGDDSHDGLSDYIDQLQILIYGKGGSYVKDGVTYNCSIDKPCPDSMRGVLNTLRSETTDLQSSLNALTKGLTSFTMTLEQFKAELTRQGISYDELDTGITTLLELIFNAQRRIDSTNNVIGTSSDTSSDGTVFGFLNDTTDTANLASNKATEVRKVLYSGSSDTGTSGNPATGTVKANLNKAQSDIGTVNTDIQGDLATQSFNSLVSLGNLLKINIWDYNWVFVCYETPEPYFRNVINDIHTRLGYTYHDFNYCYDVTNNKLYEVVTENPDNPDQLGYFAFEETNTISNAIGICSKVTHNTVKSKEIYPIIHEIGSNNIFIKNNNSWEISYNIQDYFKMTNLYKAIFEILYPIGGVYFNRNTRENPSTTIGGTWTFLGNIGVNTYAWERTG